MATVTTYWIRGYEGIQDVLSVKLCDIHADKLEKRAAVEGWEVQSTFVEEAECDVCQLAQSQKMLGFDIDEDGNK